MKKRIFLFSMLITLIGIFLFGIISTSVFYKNSINQQKEALSVYMLQYDDTVYEKNNAGAIQFSSKLNGIRVTFIDLDGTVLGDSERIETEENHLNREEVVLALKQQEGFAIRNSNSLKENYLYYCVLKEDVLVRLSLPTSSLWSIYVTTLPTTIGFILLDIVLCSVFTIVGVDSILKPIENLTKKSLLTADVTTEYKELQPLVQMIKDNNKYIDEKINAIRHDKKIETLVLDNMDHGIVILNEQFHIILINQAAATLLHVLKDEEQISFLLEDKELYETLKKKENALFYRQLSNKEYAIRITYTEHSYVLLLTDVTEIKRMEKSKNDFIANVTHEMNTPLTSIRGFAELIASGSLDERQVKHACEVILRQTKRLSLLIKNIINYSSLEADDLEEYDVNVSSVVEGVCHSLSSTTHDKNVTIHMNIQPNLFIRSRNEKILEIATNLISNAIKYNRQDGNVEVCLSENDNQIILSVSDTGIGIAPENFQKIFDRFFTVDRSHNENSSGFGLGLAIVKKICKQEGFIIDLQSEVQKGSTFTIYMKKQ